MLTLIMLLTLHGMTFLLFVHDEILLNPEATAQTVNPSSFLWEAVYLYVYSTIFPQNNLNEIYYKYMASFYSYG